MILIALETRFSICTPILDKPIKGQAYRSLEFNKQNEYCDVIVSQICRELGFAPNLLGIMHDITLWIDPYEVTIRYVTSS